MKALRVAGALVTAILLIAAFAYLFRSDPMGPIAGKRLSGEELPYPADWSECNQHKLVAVESRPDDPHSVTTLCFVHAGVMYIPALNGSDKNWPGYVAADPRVRIKMGESVYVVSALRESAVSSDDLAASIIKKYAQAAERDPADEPADVWYFRIEPRAGPS